jgi:osmotically-inducible protein OsmY
MRALSAFVLFGFLLAICQPVLAQKNSDDEIYDRVRQRLAANRDVKGGAIEVDVKDGVVTLSGKVTERRQKTKAEQVTRKTKGVKKVINQLQVEIPAARSAPAASQP